MHPFLKKINTNFNFITQTMVSSSHKTKSNICYYLVCCHKIDLSKLFINYCKYKKLIDLCNFQ